MSKTSVRRFRVAVAAHSIPPRWSILEHERVVYERDERAARTHGVRSAHVEADVPPLRSLMRLSWPYTSAEAEAGYDALA
jgi:hypothetical protein